MADTRLPASPVQRAVTLRNPSSIFFTLGPSPKVIATSEHDSNDDEYEKTKKYYSPGLGRKVFKARIRRGALMMTEPNSNSFTVCMKPAKKEGYTSASL